MTDSASTFTSADARRAARNAGAIAAAQILSKGALFAWQLVLIPLLGPTEYGMYGTVSALVQVGAVITAFGMGNIVIREVARRQADAGRYLSAALVGQTVLALLAYLGVNAAAALLGYAPDVRGLLALAALSLGIDMLGNLCYDQLQAREKMVTTAAVEVGHVVVRIAAAGLALYAGYGLLGVYIATLLTGLLRAALLWTVVLRDGVRPQFPLDRATLRRLLTDSAPLAAASLVGTAHYNADRLVTASLIGSEAVGFLSAAFVIIVGMVELLSTSVLIAVYPVMARTSAADGSPALFQHLVDKLAFFTFVVVLPVTLAISWFADALTSVFGADFAPTASILRLMVWYALLTMVSNVYAQALLTQNRQRLTLIIRAFGLALNLALLLILLPRLGVNGAPVALLAAEGLVLFLLVRTFYAGRAGAAAELPGFLGKLARVLAAGVAGALVMLLIGGPPLAVHSFGAAVFGGAAGIAVYGGALLMLRAFAPDDWALLRRLAEAMPGGARLVARFSRG